MNTITPLIFRPQPFDDEGMQGFILRLAEGNHVTPTRRLWNKAIPSPDILVSLLGLTEVRWTERLFRQDDDKGNNRPLWNRRTRRYCPDCLHEKPYWRQGWELSLMTVCTVHSVSLIEVCPICDQVQSWKKGNLLSCICGHDLRHSKSLTADQKELKLAKVLNRKVLGHDSNIPNLKLLELEQLHSLIVTIGVYGKAGVRTAMREQKVDSIACAQQLMGTASEIFT